MCVQIIHLEIPESRSWNDGTESPSCHVIHITFMQLEYKLLKIQVHTSPLVLVDLSAVLLFGFIGNHTVILIFRVNWRIWEYWSCQLCLACIFCISKSVSKIVRVVQNMQYKDAWQFSSCTFYVNYKQNILIIICISPNLATILCGVTYIYYLYFIVTVSP